MTVDRVLAVFSLAVFVAFLGIIVYFVAEADLAIVVLIVIAMAAYDFYRSAFRGSGRNSGPDTPSTN